MQKLTLARLGALGATTLALACSSGSPAPQSEAPAPSDSGWTRWRPPPPPREGVMHVTAFGRHADGGVVAFDVASGRELARLALEGPLLDLVWDAARRRLLAAVQDPEMDAARVVALRWNGAELTVFQRSELFSGDVRVHADAASTLALSRELGTTWTLLDDALSPEGLGKAWFAPSGLYNVGRERRWIGLDASAFEDGRDADAIVSVSHAPTWQAERWILPAPGRPASVLVSAPDLDEAWLVRQHDGDARALVGQTLTVSPFAPELRSVSLPLSGSLEGATLSTAPDALVLLERVESGLALMALPLARGVSSAVRLSGDVDGGAWLPRNPVSAAEQGLVLVATTDGARAFRVRGNSQLPALSELSVSHCPNVRPPLALQLP